MAVVQFIIVFCFVVIVVFFTIVLCGIFGLWTWECFHDDIADWKQNRLKDSMQVLDDTLRAKGLLVGCFTTVCSQSELD